MTSWAAAVAWAVLIEFTLLGPALAETPARIAARLDIVVRSGTCPAPAVEIPITRSSDYCGLTDFSRDDNEYYVERERCRRELDPLQSAQHRYNAFIRKCQQIGQQKKATEPTTNEKFQQITEHEQNQKRDAEAEEARKKSEKSRQEAEEAAMRALEAHRERRERVEKLAEEEAAKASKEAARLQEERRRELEHARRWICVSDLFRCVILCDLVHNPSQFREMGVGVGNRSTCIGGCRYGAMSQCVEIHPEHRGFFLQQTRERGWDWLPPE
jgi:hypothetical protein